MSPGVTRRIVALQKSPRWRDRDRAAQELRHVDWRAHPEVVGALAFSLLNDPEEEVREEAAESLARMRPCLPEAREALRIAATDRDLMTRKWARRGLAALPAACRVPCPVVVEPADAPPPPPPRPYRAPGVEPPTEVIPDGPIESTVPPPPADELEPLPPPNPNAARRATPPAPRVAVRANPFRVLRPGR
jgi:hypothetical protein